MSAKGRPPVYSREIADRICHEISHSSKSLRTICKPDDMPAVNTVLNWLHDNTDDFLGRYNRAKQEQADFMVEEMLEIADDSSNDLMQTKYGPQENKEVTNRSKLRVETRKWIAARLKPKKYGDKLDVTSDGEKLQPTIIKWGDRDINV